MQLSAVAADCFPFLLLPAYRNLGKPQNRHISGTYAHSQGAKGVFLQDDHRSTVYLAAKTCKGRATLWKPLKESRGKAAVFQDDWQEVDYLQAAAKD